jgi:hypothetical protein
VERRHLPRILHDENQGAVLVPATLVGSEATAALVPVQPARAEVLAGAAAHGGGLWVVRGSRWAGVVTAGELLNGTWEHLRESEVPILFDGERPRALLLDALDPIDLLVPVDGWERGRTFYFHSDSPLFALVPVLRKVNHRVTVRRGEVSEEDRKVIGRRMVEGQTCGVLGNELGGLCVVPDGEIATDVRAVYAERVRFIVDGLRDLSVTATVLREWAERFETAAGAGWVLERPIGNSFLYAVNRRRLRTLLPLPAIGALVPVGPAIDLPIPDESAAGDRRRDHGPPGAAALPDRDTIAPLAVAAAAAAAEDEEEDGDGEAATVDPLLQVGDELVERFAAELMARAPETPPPHETARGEATLPVLRRTVFRRPRGRLLRPETGGRLFVASITVRSGAVELVRGTVPTAVAGRLAATVADDDTITGAWALCHGAFGYVLAEMGAPLRAIESLSSSVSYAHLLDGSEHLYEAAQRLRGVAERLESLAADGWTLSQPIAGFWLRLRPPLRPGA